MNQKPLYEFRGNFILDKDGNPIEEPDLIKWASAFKSGERIVEQTDVNGVFVSTVFLATDYNFTGKGLPVLWETMVFVDGDGRWDERYTSKADAIAGHKKWVEDVKNNPQKYENIQGTDEASKHISEATAGN